MKVILNGEELDINDDERILSQCKSLATHSIMLIPARQKIPALTELLAAIRYGYVKAGAVLAQAEVMGKDEVPRAVLAQFVDYLREIVGESRPQIQKLESINDEDSKDSVAEASGSGDALTGTDTAR